MSKNKLAPRLVIAGPGSGKTTDMVSEILAVLPNLASHRVLATVTYTNSAAETIRKRLFEKAGLPKNVFVGTIHSFLNQFIVIPYATLFEHAGLEKLFLEIDVDGIVESKIPKSIKKNTPLYFGTKGKIKNQLLTGLLRNGRIPLSQISSLALGLMEIDSVCSAVCNRLQFLFIDEFQDVDIVQFKIFDGIRKTNNTNIYAVGDPEQYIMGYTYQGKQKPSFEDLPINRFKADRRPKIENYRASAELVAFTNQFHFEIKQTAINGSNPQSRIVFISKSSLSDIVHQFQKLCNAVPFDGSAPLHFYLSVENKTFEEVSGNHGLSPLQVQTVGGESALDKALDLICGFVGLTKRQISEKYRLEPLEVRKKGVMLLDAISKNEVCDKESAERFIQDTLGLSIAVDYKIGGKDLLHSLMLKMQTDQNVLVNHQYSSIHKAKGLEAEFVLVVARNRNELNRWLNADKDARAKDGSDSCRVGYVAFTRAKILLCIACLESVEESDMQLINNMGISVIS